MSSNPPGVKCISTGSQHKKIRDCIIKVSNYLNCYKISSGEWFISEKLLPILRFNVQFFDCLKQKSKWMGMGMGMDHGKDHTNN